MRRLSRTLRLRRPYSVEPLEFLPGHEPEPRFRSPWVFTQPPELTGRSMELALAVGLASADQEQAVPSWVLMSGTVRNQVRKATQAPRIGPVAGLRRKIKSALGIGEGNVQVPGLLEEFYRSAEAVRYLGPKPDRTVAGGVRLFLGPPEFDVFDVGALRSSCHVQEVQLTLDQLRQIFRNGPPSTVRTLADADVFKLPPRWRPTIADRTDWMLFVQTPTLAEALLLQGLKAPWRTSTRPLRCQLILARRGPTGRPVRDEEDWENRGRVLREHIDRRMQECASPYEQLRVLLELFVKELDRQPGLEGACFNGTTGRVSRDRRLIYVLERISGLAVADPDHFSARRLFQFYSTEFGPTVPALTEKRAVLAPNMKYDPSVQRSFAFELDEFARAYRIPPDLVPRQAEFLGRIGSYICVPVIDPVSPEPIGVVSLLMDRPIDPDLVPKDLLRLFETLAEAAVGPLQKFTAQVEIIPPGYDDAEAESERRNRMYEGRDYHAEPAEAAESIHAFRHGLAVELARQICQLPGVYRTAVRLLDPNGSLSVIGEHGDFHEEWLKQAIPALDVPLGKLCSTGPYAVRTRRDIFLDDTGYLYDGEGMPIPHRPVGPKLAKAHASILLQFCGQILGVLSVDFEAKHIPPAIRTALRELANRFALDFKACRIDDEFSQLEGDFSAHACLTHVARMIGAQYGALFERNPDSGLYVLTKIVGKHTEKWKKRWLNKYGAGLAPGQGLVGWIVRHNRALRRANSRQLDNQVPAAAGGEAPPWNDLAFSDEEFGEQAVAYLGVPASAGEVHAVLRFVTPITSPGSGFTTYDEQVAWAAARRLGLSLEEQRSKKRDEARRALFDLFWRMPDLHDRQRSLARKVFTVLQQAIGECSCGIRLADKVVAADGTARLAMRRLACTDRDWERKTPMYRDDPTSLSMTCFVKDEAIDVEDRAQAKYVAALYETIRRDYGHFFMCPLGGRAGVIHVTRKRKGHVFAESDKRFVRHLGGLLGPVMQKVAEDEQAYWEERILKRLLNPPKSGGLVACLERVLRYLAFLLQPEWSGVWVREGDRFILGDGSGRPMGSPSLAAPTVADAVGPKGARLVTFLPDDPTQRAVLADLLPASVGAPETWPERDRAALPVRAADGGALAVFVFVARDRETMSVRRLDHLTRFLRGLRTFIQNRSATGSEG